MRHLALALSLSLVFCVLPGCGQKYSMLPVGGRVLMANGKPLAGAQVTFECDQPAVSATGVTDEQGNFRLGTIRDDDGAPAGAYRVSIRESADADPDHPRPSQIAKKYADPSSSGLKFTVDKQHTTFEIKL